MTTLAKSKVRSYALDPGHNQMPVIAAEIIYEGAAVSDKLATNVPTGYAQPLVAGEPFVGFAIEDVDNSLGGAGAKNVKLLDEGYIELPVADAAITDEGRAVYASDDDTFTFTATNNTYIGFVRRYVSAGKVLVQFKARSLSPASIAALTDSSGGTASDTIAAIGGSYSQTEVRNAVATLAARVKALYKMLGVG